MPYGVSSQMIEAWGPVIFDLSLNTQVRKGDPVRKLDHAAWVDQRDATGLTDDEIADRIGLARPQVTFIRNVLERRVFRTNQYRKLYRLGGGLRWRPDEYVDPEEAYAVRPEAALLRQALAFDRGCVSAWIAGGQWRPETLWQRIARAANDRPDGPAVTGDGPDLGWGAFHADAEALAAGLAAQGVGRGETVALALQAGRDLLAVTAAVWRVGGVVLPLPAGLTESAAADLLHRGRARALVIDPAGASLDADALGRLANMLPALTVLVSAGAEIAPATPLSVLRNGEGRRRMMPPVGGDPALLLVSNGRLAPHTHQTLLASARGLGSLVGNGTSAGLSWSGPVDGPGFALAVACWLSAAVPFSFGPPAPGAAGLRAGGDRADGLVEVEIASGSGEARALASPECPALLVREPGSETWRVPEGGESRLGEDGRLELRGPGAAPAYVDDPAGTAAAFAPGGWLRTGLAAGLDAASGTIALDV